MVSGDDTEDEEGMEPTPSLINYIMHFVTLFWKILFALIPPTGILYVHRWKVLELKHKTKLELITRSAIFRKYIELTFEYLRKSIYSIFWPRIWPAPVYVPSICRYCRRLLELFRLNFCDWNRDRNHWRRCILIRMHSGH